MRTEMWGEDVLLRSEGSAQKLATAAVLLYLLVGAVASIPYHKWIKRKQPDVENQVKA